MGLGQAKKWGEILKSSYGASRIGEELTPLDTMFCTGELHAKLPDSNKWMDESRKIPRTSKDKSSSKAVYFEIFWLKTRIFAKKPSSLIFEWALNTLLGQVVEN